MQCCDTVLVNISVYSYRMASKEKRGRITFRDQCQVCGANSPYVYRHMLRVHLPWYVNPTTSCVDCHVSAGNARELQNMHGRHRLFSGEHLLQAWFLLLNGMFLFISQEMGLGSPMELLGCAVVQEFTPSPQGTSTLAAKQVYDLLKDMDMLDHPIHRHCFVGGYNEYKQWSTDLPNCYFSISPVTVKDPRSMFALSSLDGRKRLLLETDASYLAQYPWNVSNVAEETVF